MRQFFRPGMLLLVLLATDAMAGEIPVSSIFPPFKHEAALQEEKLSPADFKELEEGEIITRTRPMPKGKKDGAHLMAATLVNGSVEDVFAVIMDCKNGPKFIPHLVTCTSTYAPAPSEPAVVNFEQTEKLKFGFAFVTKEVGYTVSSFAMRPYVRGWTLKKGDIDDTEGYWRVIPYKDGKHVLLYDVYTNPGTVVPDWVQSILVKQDLPNTVEAYKNRAEKKAAAK